MNGDVDQIEHGLELGFSPLRDALAGPTYGDNVRHAIVRIALLQELIQNPAVTALFDCWAERTGIGPASIALARAGVSVAEIAGLESYGDIYELSGEEICQRALHRAQGESGRLTQEDESRIEGVLEEAFEEVHAALHEWEVKVTSVSKEGARRMGDEATELVLEWQMPWPWLALELVAAFYLATSGCALGRIYRRNVWVEYPQAFDDRPAPELEWTFRTQPGESRIGAQERLIDEFLEALAKVSEPEIPLPPVGRVPNRTIPALERNARWFYLHRVCGESIRSIAKREFADDGGAERWKDVHRGVKRAEELLSLASYGF